MEATIPRLNPRKLLHSKWTAVAPTRRERHFIVTAVMVPDSPTLPIEYVDLEAVHSKRTQRIPWRHLTDTSTWLQGWR